MEEKPEGKSQDLFYKVSLRNKNQEGAFAELVQIIANKGGHIGVVTTAQWGEKHVYRGVVIKVKSEEHFQDILKAIRKLSRTTVLEVKDLVQEIHEQGKIGIALKYQANDPFSLHLAYSPMAVGRIVVAIRDDPAKAYRYTWKGQTALIVSNGTRVLGFGNVGPEAAMPVLEGKAGLFHHFTGLNMIPQVIETEDPTKFVETVMQIHRGYSVIHLEDIASPGCYAIEAQLIENLPIPCIHIDRHGTAVVVLAAVRNACSKIGKDLLKVRVGLVGVGAAGSAIARLLSAYLGRRVLCFDKNVEALRRVEGLGGRAASLSEVMQCDLVIASTGVGRIIPKSLVQKDQVILALSNPEPDISEEDAQTMGVAIYSPGRLVNNVLAYPGLIKGAIDTQATRFCDEMFIAASDALVMCTPTSGEEIVPNAYDSTVHHNVAKAVAAAAIKAGVARKHL